MAGARAGSGDLKELCERLTKELTYFATRKTMAANKASKLDEGTDRALFNVIVQSSKEVVFELGVVQGLLREVVQVLRDQSS